MNHTTRHAAAAAAWFIGWPVVIFALIASKAIPLSQFHASILSLAWGMGLLATFASWSFTDAPQHGRSVYFAAAFSALWFLLFILAVPPYLLATRGLRRGAVATVAYIGLCLACLAGLLALGYAFRAVTFAADWLSGAS